MENKQQYAAVLTALERDPIDTAMLRTALQEGGFAPDLLSPLLPRLYRYYDDAAMDEQTAAALRLLLQHGANPEQTDAEGLSAYDKLEQALDHVKSYAEAEHLRLLWRIMKSEGPMPVFSGVLAWTTPDFHEAYNAERTALKKAEGFSLFGRKKPAAIDRYFTAENFYYRYDAESLCYLLYERSTDKLAGGRGDIPKKYKAIAIAESWRG